MRTPGKNFWAVFLPLHILGAAGLWFLPEYWTWLLFFWFTVGVVGNGVAGHRYFAHGQFETYTPVRWVLGFLTTLGGVGPATDWRIQHKMHHLRADQYNDPHSPYYSSRFDVFYGWYIFQHKGRGYLTERFARKMAVAQMRDSFYRFFDRNHYRIIFAFCVALAVINYHLLLMYALAVSIDFFRLGAVNWWCHRSGYRNHETPDHSTNNVWLGILGMGFGWHNNHHASPGKLVLTERWWEIDVEGYIGQLLSIPRAAKKYPGVQ
jgi:stearoyl-CoA desaturase (delta-9 desaturase)